MVAYLGAIWAIGVNPRLAMTALGLLVQAAPWQQEVAAQRIGIGMAELPGYRRPRWVHCR